MVIDANSPGAKNRHITTQIPAAKGSSSRINLKRPFSFFIRCKNYEEQKKN